jgi:anaerobic ribonucleoside-triphosphate reductase activating protein
MAEYLNIFDFCEGTKALGPGLRCVIWVQGCPFNCKGCTSPYGRPIKENILVEVSSVAQSIVRNHLIDGITISGGEPFLQASKLSFLLKTIKEARPKLTAIVYTGFDFEDLDWSEAHEFMQYIDLLIDGKYMEDLNNDKGIRGSNNQRFHYLTDKLTLYKEELENGERTGEIHIIQNNSIYHYIGIQNKNQNINF